MVLLDWRKGRGTPRYVYPGGPLCPVIDRPKAPPCGKAGARLAAVERHHPENTALVAAARRDLQVAQAAVQVAQAAALLQQTGAQ